jgi:site-specific recombinase XerC
MRKYSPENERIKRQYFAYLKEAKRHSEPTVDAAAKALHRFEEYTKFRSFKLFHTQQAIAFKNYLAEQKGLQSGEKLSKATLYATLTQLKRFFQWLAREPGYKSRIQYSDAEYFNLSDKDTRIATAQREQRAPTVEQIKHVLQTMPTRTEIERRNHALIAFTILTGARDSAVASMKLKHLDLIERCIDQDARQVKTKFSKTFSTYFFPVGTKSSESWRTGCLSLRRSGSGATTIRCSLPPALSRMLIAGSEFRVWLASIGATLRPSAQSFARRSTKPAYRTSIRTVSGTRWRGSARNCAGHRRTTRLGARISDMRRCSQRSQITAR